MKLPKTVTLSASTRYFSRVTITR